MNCSSCLEAQELDDITPDCKNGKGCLIPPLLPGPARVMQMRDKLIRLHRLKIGPEVLRMYQADLHDLDLMAMAEDLLNEKREEDGSVKD